MSRSVDFRAALGCIGTLVSVLLLGACGTIDTRHPDIESSIPVRAQQSNLAGLDAIGAARLGSLVNLVPGNSLDARQARVLDAYVAASGRDCRRVMPTSGSQRRVVCRHRSGHWRAVPVLVSDHGMPKRATSDESPLAVSVFAGQHGDRLGAAASTLVVDEPASPVYGKGLQLGVDIAAAAPDSSERKAQAGQETERVAVLEYGETLWSFARRMTGRGENWQRIAEHNNLRNVESLRDGTEIRIPLSLLK